MYTWLLIFIILKQSLYLDITAMRLIVNSDHVFRNGVLCVSDKYNYNTESDLFHIYNLHRNEMTD